MSPDSSPTVLTSIDEVQQALQKENYICDRRLATTIYLSLNRGKPLLLVGRKISEELLRHAPGTALKEIGPISDNRASKEYRREKDPDH